MKLQLTNELPHYKLLLLLLLLLLPDHTVYHILNAILRYQSVALKLLSGVDEDEVIALQVAGIIQVLYISIYIYIQLPLRISSC